MPRAKRKPPRHRHAKAITRPATIAEASARTAALLEAVACALNDCEYAGIPVRLAHGTVITEAGYIFRIGPDTAPWAVRTRLLTEFPPPPLSDDD